jgi:hypothetical protein
MIANFVATSLQCIADVPTTSKAAAVLQRLAIRVRVRIYSIYLIIPVHIFEEMIPKLLPFLVADFTLVESGQSSMGTTSLLRCARKFESLYLWFRLSFPRVTVYSDMLLFKSFSLSVVVVLWQNTCCVLMRSTFHCLSASSFIALAISRFSL